MTKPPTIHDVASALGMHKSTVSLALSGKGNISARTRARVSATAQQLGYEPNPVAQRLAKGTGSPTVCLFSGALDVGLATEKLLLIQSGLSAQGLEAPIYTGTAAAAAGETRHPQVAQMRQLCRQRPRAIICAAQRVEPAVFPELELYQAAGGVVVCYDVPVPLACDQVIFDREDNAYQAAHHLLASGHRRIGLGMSGSPRWLQAAGFPQDERLQGFRRALEEFGVPVREDWLFRNATYERGGSEMARHFLELSERPTAMSIVNDYVALAFMVEVMRAGVRVPEDVSIVSHDDQAITGYCPVPLTAASQPTGRIADAVVELLMARLGGSQAPPRTVIIKGGLVSRDSVGPPPE